MKKTLSLLSLVAPLAVSAQLTFPVQLQRVTALSEIDSEGSYGFVCLNSQGQQVALRDWLSRGRMLGQNFGTGLSDHLTLSSDSCLWNVEKDSDGNVHLLSVRVRHFLQRVSETKADLMWNKSATELSQWQLTEADEGRFLLSATGSSSRRLSMNYTSSQGDVFGNYSQSDTPMFYIYRTDGKSEETDKPTVPTISGEATKPGDGQRVAVWAADYCLTASGEGLTDSGLRLLDESLAPSNRYSSLTCHWQDNDCFALVDSDGKYLDYSLHPSAASVAWRVIDGTIQTVEAKPRTLCFYPKQKLWQLVGSATTEGLQPARFLPIATAPESSRKANGTLCLTGGWSASALASLDLSQASGLDLSALSLPVQLLPFEAELARRNLPIYIVKGAAALVPESWRFVVACDGEKASLLQTTTLTDCSPLVVDRPITLRAGQMNYVRSISAAGWQTLSLPFVAQMTSTSATAFSVRQQGGDSLEIHAEPLLSADGAYLLRLKEPQTLTLTNTDCTLHPFSSSSMGATLYATFQPITVEQTEDAVYLLSPSSQQFVHAAAGSRLAPFRAYLKLKDSTPSPSRLLRFSK